MSFQIDRLLLAQECRQMATERRQQAYRAFDAGDSDKGDRLLEEAAELDIRALDAEFNAKEGNDEN